MNFKVIVRAKEELECLLLRQSWQRRKSSLLLMRSTARRPHWTGVRRMRVCARTCKGEGGVQKTWEQCLHSLSSDWNDAKMSTFIRTWRVLILCLVQTSVIFHLSGQNVQHYFGTTVFPAADLLCVIYEDKTGTWMDRIFRYAEGHAHGIIWGWK